MVSLPAISGGEFARALERGGFVVYSVDHAVITLRRGTRDVTLPLDGIIEEPSVHALLSRAGMSIVEFLELLSRSLHPTAAATPAAKRSRPRLRM